MNVSPESSSTTPVLNPISKGQATLDSASNAPKEIARQQPPQPVDPGFGLLIPKVQSPGGVPVFRPKRGSAEFSIRTSSDLRATHAQTSSTQEEVNFWKDVWINKRQVNALERSILEKRRASVPSASAASMVQQAEPDAYPMPWEIVERPYNPLGQR